MIKKLAIVIVLMSAFYSCKTAEQHLQKFYDKGGKLETVERLVTVYDTIVGANGKDSIVEIEVKVPCPEPKAPKTKWEVRFDNKRFDDSLNHIQALYKDRLKFALRNNRIDSKETESLARINKDLEVKIKRFEKQVAKAELNRWNFFWFGVIVGAIVVIAIIIFYRKIKKRLSFI